MEVFSTTFNVETVHAGSRYITASGKRGRNAFETQSLASQQSPQLSKRVRTADLPVPPPAPAVTATQLQLEELPSVPVAQFSLEKITALKEACKRFVALALVAKPATEENTIQGIIQPTHIRRPKRHPEHSAGSRCVDSGIGMQVNGFLKVDCLLIRKTSLSLRMHPRGLVPGTFDDETTTATKIIVNDLEYQVTVIDGCEYCLAVLDERKASNNYMFTLDATTQADVLSLSIWTLPPCGHYEKDDRRCLRCAKKLVSTQNVMIPQLWSGRELWRGNWGEVWDAAWINVNPEGAFNLSEPLKRVAVKRIFNVLRSPLGMESPDTRDYIFFQHVDFAKSEYHERGVTDPSTIGNSYDLRDCFQGRNMFLENQMREAEITQLQVGLDGQCLTLDTFGIDYYNLYIITELLPGASLRELLRRLPAMRMHEATARLIMRRLFAFLRDLHRRSVAHCDLKLDNVAFSIVPAHQDDEALKNRVSPFSTGAFVEEDFQRLLAVVIDFGQARWAPGALPGADDPLRVEKRLDVRCLGRMLFQMVTGYSLPRDLSTVNLDVVYHTLASGGFLSPPGVVLLRHLLQTANYTAADAHSHPW